MPTCSLCATEKDGKSGRLPGGWSDVAGRVVCKKCKRIAFVVRASSLAIARPLSIDTGTAKHPSVAGMGWREFDDRMHVLWVQTRTLKNRAVAELARHDVMPGHDGLIAPRPKLNLYACLVSEKDGGLLGPSWQGAKGNVTGVIKAVEEKYHKERFDVFAMGTRSLSSYREEGTAYHVHNREWSAAEGGGGEMLLAFSVPSLDTSLPWLPPRFAERYGGRLLPSGRITVVLMGGHERRRQRADFMRVASGGAKQSELQVYRQRSTSTRHRHVHDDREPGGGAKTPSVTMVKFVFTSARQSRTDTPNVLDVRTASDHFLSCRMSDGESQPVWVENADHIRRAEQEAKARGWIETHADMLGRVALDTKHEHRVPRRNRRQIDDAVARRCAKQRDRIRTFMHQSVASIRGLCLRRRVGTVIYDDRDRSYFRSFPWAAFAARLADALSAEGIRLLHSGGAEISTPGEATCQTSRATLATASSAAASRAAPPATRGPKLSRSKGSATVTTSSTTCSPPSRTKEGA